MVVISTLGPRIFRAFTLVNYGSHSRQKPSIFASPPHPPFSIFTLASIPLTIFIERQLCPRHWAKCYGRRGEQDIFGALP